MNNKIEPVHPGEVLEEEFLKPWGISRNQLARLMGVNVSRVHEIVHKRRGITGDTALRLARVTGMSPEFWLGIQNLYDIEKAKDELGDRLDQEVTPANELLAK
ncbi:MAG: HigA family addiction module antidote protein [Anaerolineales bacterium]|nr:HigA family addiction module antidote protein [Anaerolineales bacterium]